MNELPAHGVGIRQIKAVVKYIILTRFNAGSFEGRFVSLQNLPETALRDIEEQQCDQVCLVSAKCLLITFEMVVLLTFKLSVTSFIVIFEGCFIGSAPPAT